MIPAAYRVKTYCEWTTRTRMLCLGDPYMNQVQRRIQELASFQLGRKKRYVRAVRRKAVVPNRRYSWMLFENAADREPVDTVVMDVDLVEAIEIDRKVAEAFSRDFIVEGLRQL